MLQLNEIVVASKNKDKIEEINFLLSDFNIKVLTPRELNIDIPSSIEQFSTYEENSKAKGDYVFEKVNKPTLSDDSGLEVISLNGKPGIFSSRYSQTLKDSDNRKKLIYELRNVPDSERSAKFICVLYFRINNKYNFFRGEVNGIILSEERGDKGFGYDPIFYYQEKGKTFAEMSFQEKFAVSHRGIALRKFKEFLESYTEGGS